MPPTSAPAPGDGRYPAAAEAVNAPSHIRELIARHLAEHGAPAGVPTPESGLAGPGDGAPYDLVVRAGRMLVDGAFRAGELGVRGGVITAIEPEGSELAGADVLELSSDEVLLPGLVDTHVHINEPGRTEWEGFASATRAAAAGGVTTVVDMPLNSIPSTVNTAALEYKKLFAEGAVHVDLGFWAGAIPGNLEDVRPLQQEGVFGFKCFLAPSGVDEFPPLEPAQFQAHLAEVSAAGSLLIVHAEDPSALAAAPQASGRQYGSFLASRPRGAEDLAIQQVIDGVRDTGGRAHILHLSSADSLPALEAARQEGLDLSVETCPHYLTLAAEEILDGVTAAKCCPPVREGRNREELWQALQDGTIDMIVSDHSPSTPELKDVADGDFGAAWGGVSSLQLGLPLIWTEARRRGIGLEQVVQWMSTAPARRMGLEGKGALTPGADADLVVFAPQESFLVDGAQLHHRHPVTPYQHKELDGRVRETFLRGRRVDGAAPSGRLLERGLMPARSVGPRLSDAR